MKLECSLIEADKPTVNGRIYPRESLEKAIEDFNAKDEEVVHIGTLGTCTELSLDKASHEIKDLWLTEDGYMEAEVKLLDTIYGRLAKSLDSSLLQLSPTFTATVNEDMVVDVDSIQHINIIMP